LCAGATQAEPSPTVRYLTGESVSLLEWGIFRLETRVQAFIWDDLDTKTQSQRASVKYDWDKNQLTVNLAIYPRYPNFEKSTPKEICGSLMGQMKYYFGVAPGPAEVSRAMRNLYGIGTYFRHQYFVKANAPKTLDEDMETITTLEIDVMASKNDQPPFQTMISCSSDLLKTEIRYFLTEPK
jgi:hypothetical protein